MSTMFDERRARSATTKEEAQQSIRDFIREGLHEQSRHNIVEKSRGFDLYLPWMMEVIEYVEPYPDKEPHKIPELHRLYMDAAWDLVMQGLLRPGPKAMAGGSDNNAYGRAFSLVGGVEP